MVEHNASAVDDEEEDEAQEPALAPPAPASSKNVVATVVVFIVATGVFLGGAVVASRPSKSATVASMPAAFRASEIRVPPMSAISSAGSDAS